MQRTLAAVLVLIFIAIVGGLVAIMLRLSDPRLEDDIPSLVEQRRSVGPVGTFAPTPVYTRTPDMEKLLVEDRELLLPFRDRGDSIWGATGRDRKGRIWFGVSGTDQADARLVRYDPRDGSMKSAGGVLENLRTLGLLRVGEHQAKIHSRIIAAADGYLYFTSMDETGEDPKLGKLPRWGSHLWRIEPQSLVWEHLGAVPEALIALDVGGQWVYALGYWNHVLYQFDTLTQKLHSRTIGAAQGHVSRNLVADERGHVFVPRVAEEPADSGQFVSTLVELSPELEEVRSTPIEYYSSQTEPGRSHGIVGVAKQKDGSQIILVNGGALYRISSSGTLPAAVEKIGMLPEYPAGRGESLFDLDGRSYLAGAMRVGQDWKIWVLNWETGTSRVLDLDWRQGHRSKLLYGSMTRDDEGNLYLAGQAKNGSERSAVALRVSLLEGALTTATPE